MSTALVGQRWFRAWGPPRVAPAAAPVARPAPVVSGAILAPSHLVPGLPLSATWSPRPPAGVTPAVAGPPEAAISGPLIPPARILAGIPLAAIWVPTASPAQAPAVRAPYLQCIALPFGYPGIEGLVRATVLVPRPPVELGPGYSGPFPDPSRSSLERRAGFPDPFLSTARLRGT